MNKKLFVLSCLVVISTTNYFLHPAKKTRSVGTQTKNNLDPDKNYLIGIEYLKRAQIKKSLFFFEQAAKDDYTVAQYALALIIYNNGDCTNSEVLKAYHYCNLAAKKNLAEAKKLLIVMLPDVMAAKIEEKEKPIKIDLAELLGSIAGAQEKPEDDEEEENENTEKKEQDSQKNEMEKARKRIKKQGPPPGMYV